MLEVIEPHRLAKAARVLTGQVKAADLERFSKLLVSDEGMIAYEISFEIDKEGFTVVRGHLAGEVMVRCQRCMGVFARKIENSFVLTPISEAKPTGLPEDYESVNLVDGKLDLAEVIEDELILGMPMAAMHDVGDQDCIPVLEVGAGESEIEEIGIGLVQNNPFAVLDGLRKERADKICKK